MKLLIFIFFLSVSCGLKAQNGRVVLTGRDTTFHLSSDTSRNTSPAKDTAAIKHKPPHLARIATRRSAIIPGWGQAYNREYWKIPIIYGALAIPTYTFLYNNLYYKLTKFAYNAEYDSVVLGINTYTSQIDPRVRYSNGALLSIDDYQNYRNQFRKNRDLSVFWFLILWGLNVADACVFGNLKDFDVSSDLSMHMETNFFLNPVSKLPEMGFVFNFKKPSPKVKLIEL